MLPPFSHKAFTSKQHTNLRARLLLSFIALSLAALAAAAALFLRLSPRQVVRLLRFMIDVIDYWKGGGLLLEGRVVVVRNGPEGGVSSPTG